MQRYFGHTFPYWPLCVFGMALVGPAARRPGHGWEPPNRLVPATQASPHHLASNATIPSPNRTSESGSRENPPATAGNSVEIILRVGGSGAAPPQGARFRELFTRNLIWQPHFTGYGRWVAVLASASAKRLAMTIWAWWLSSALTWAASPAIPASLFGGS